MSKGKGGNELTVRRKPDLTVKQHMPPPANNDLSNARVETSESGFAFINSLLVNPVFNINSKEKGE